MVRASLRKQLVSRRFALGCSVAALLAMPSAGRAQGASAAENKPFAEHRLVLQLSDRAEDKQALVLSVAYNLLTAYGPDKIAIEIVAFGPGIDLLLAHSPHRARVDSLYAQGVKFDICGNTLDTIERNTGKRPQINPNATTVAAGAARILELTEQHFTLIRP